MTQSPQTADKSPRTKKKTWRNTREYSATSAYLLTSHSENPNCTLSSHRTTNASRKRLPQLLTSADEAIVRTSIRHGKLPSCEKQKLTSPPLHFQFYSSVPLINKTTALSVPVRPGLYLRLGRLSTRHAWKSRSSRCRVRRMSRLRRMWESENLCLQKVLFPVAWMPQRRRSSTSGCRHPGTLEPIRYAIRTTRAFWQSGSDAMNA